MAPKIYLETNLSHLSRGLDEGQEVQLFRSNPGSDEHRQLPICVAMAITRLSRGGDYTIENEPVNKIQPALDREILIPS